jgi:hypothetical protein
MRLCRMKTEELEERARMYRGMEADTDPGLKWSEDQKKAYRQAQAIRAELFEELADRRKEMGA